MGLFGSPVGSIATPGDLVVVDLFLFSLDLCLHTPASAACFQHVREITEIQVHKCAQQEVKESGLGTGGGCSTGAMGAVELLDTGTALLPHLLALPSLGSIAMGVSGPSCPLPGPGPRVCCLVHLGGAIHCSVLDLQEAVLSFVVYLHVM